MSAGDVIIRELAGLDELKAAERLQLAVWGEDDPYENSDLMLAIQHEGGLIAGAFRGDDLIGFLFGFPTSDPKIQHSHRLATHKSARGLGLGARLKWFQRDWCLERGITLVRWTYDPLRALNAGLNIHALGAGAGRYFENYYGEMKGINAGLPSDRLLAEWRLDAPHVEARANGRPGAAPEGEPVAIPANIDALMRDDMPAALEARLALRAALQSAFAKGLRVIGFNKETPAYILGKE